jgi:isoleucyl-tRNA synthetase
MAECRLAVEKAHALRKEANLKVRQPLASLNLTSTLPRPQSNLLAVIAAEVNVKKVVWHQGDSLTVSLDTQITPALKAEGEARELVRQIMDLRKQAKTAVSEKVVVELPYWPTEFETYIKTKVLAESLKLGPELKLIRML